MQTLKLERVLCSNIWKNPRYFYARSGFIFFSLYEKDIDGSSSN